MLARGRARCSRPARRPAARTRDCCRKRRRRSRVIGPPRAQGQRPASEPDPGRGAACGVNQARSDARRSGARCAAQVAVLLAVPRQMPAPKRWAGRWASVKEVLAASAVRGRFRLMAAADVGPGSAHRGAARAGSNASSRFDLSNEKRATLIVFDRLRAHANRRLKSSRWNPAHIWRDCRRQGQMHLVHGLCQFVLRKALCCDSKKVAALRFIERNCVQCGLCDTAHARNRRLRCRPDSA